MISVGEEVGVEVGDNDAPIILEESMKIPLSVITVGPSVKNPLEGEAVGTLVSSNTVGADVGAIVSSVTRIGAEEGLEVNSATGEGVENKSLESAAVAPMRAKNINNDVKPNIFDCLIVVVTPCGICQYKKMFDNNVIEPNYIMRGFEPYLLNQT